MKKLFVEDVKVGVSRGGMACGPVSGSVVAEVCIRDLEEETVKYYSLTEVEGIPNFFETDVSTYDQQIEEVDDEEFWDMLSEHTASDFTDYVDVFANQEEMELHDPDHLLIWKYLIYMVRADEDRVEQLKAKSVGKCLGDFKIPVCDVEQEYLDENSEELEDTEPDDQECLLERLNDEFSGSAIDMSNFDDLDEDESPAACYSSYVKFNEGYPGIRYELLLGDYGEIEQWIFEGRVDCGFLRLPTREEYETISLGKDEYVAVLPVDHPLAQRDVLSPDDLDGQPFMLLEHGGKTEVSELLEKYRVTPDVRFTTWDDYAILSMVESGLGIGVLPRLILRRIPYRVEIRSFSEPFFREIALAMKCGGTSSVAVQRFVQYLEYRD